MNTPSELNTHLKIALTGANGRIGRIARRDLSARGDALRATDRLAISKLVSSLTKAAVKSPLAQCLLVRYVAQVIQV